VSEKGEAMSDKVGEQPVTHRETWVVRVCPECNGQTTGDGAAHYTDCPNTGKVFAIREVEVVSSEWRERAERAEAELEALSGEERGE
jgi:hypothetical protein